MCGRAAVPKKSASIKDTKSSRSSGVPSTLNLRPGRITRLPGVMIGAKRVTLFPPSVNEPTFRQRRISVSLSERSERNLKGPTGPVFTSSLP